MTSSPQPITRSARRNRRDRARLAGLLVVTSVVLSSCTFQSGKQFEVDYFGSKYRFYVYEKPSFLLLALRNDCMQRAGERREQWGRCSLTYLRDKVEVQALTKVDWNHFTEGGQWDDYTDAIANVAKGTVRKDAAGQLYVDRCSVGDHSTFGSYNWTYRLTSDAHCKHGEYPS